MGRDCPGAHVTRFSAIDIGTNTILMLIADVDATGAIRVVRDEHAIARLGKGVDENRMISPETFERVLRQLSEYKRIHESEHSERLIACGTSALRDSANSKEFIDFIRVRLGFEIAILDGDEEAELTYLGGVSEFLAQGHEQQFAVLDIGGGSSELVTGRGTITQSKISLDIGSVRLTERFLKTSPPRSEQLAEARNYVASHIQRLAPLAEGMRFIGVAGTLTTLAALDLQLQTYDRNRVSGHVLTLNVIEMIFDDLKGKHLRELKAIPQIVPQRADIILAGILILIEIMKKIGAKRILVSDRGLRYGILLKHAQEQTGRREA